MTSPPPPHQLPPPSNEASDYESDHSDAPLRRRAAASDDEGSAAETSGNKPSMDEDLDGQGAAEVYEEEYGDEDEGEEYEEEFVGEENVYSEEVAVKAWGYDDGAESEVKGEEEGVQPEAVNETAGDGRGIGEEEGKKIPVPYAVPTTGAFYMHDDRFNENGRGRGHRRMFGGRKLWNHRDERAWVHDRFDEMNHHESRYDEDRRRPRGQFRGRGNTRSRGAGRGYYRSNRPRGYYDDNQNPNSPQKVFRGSGTRRYQPRWKNVSETSSTLNKSLKAPETSVPNDEKYSLQAMSAQSEPVLPKKNINSNLNYASPPFYPSGSSRQEFPVLQRRDLPTVSGRSQDGSLRPLPGRNRREKNVGASASHGQYSEDSVHTGTLRSLSSSAIASSGSATFNSSEQFSASKNHIRAATTQEHQFPVAASQAPRISTHAQLPSVHPRTVQTTDQSAQRITNQMFALQIDGYNPMQTLHSPSVSLVEDRLRDTSPGSNKSNTQLSGSKKSNSQVAEMGSFLYGGTLGTSRSMGIALGDQGFPGTPALLPVMQFNAQNSGNPGVQAVGMALPGYVAPQQLGLGNSEMTWLPVLAGTAGPLGGGAYPYIALDGSFYPLSSGPAPPATSMEGSTSKASSAFKSQQLPAETMNDDVGQRQNKPRRYSEMNFSQ